MSREVTIGHNNHRYRVLEDWGNSQSANYPVRDCHEMVIDSRGRIILLTNETQNNILIYNRDGKITSGWGNSFPGAHGLTITGDADEQFLFITDCERHEVIKTTLDGKVIMILTYPSEISEYSSPALYKPTETAVAANGDIYVTDGYGLQFIIQYTSKGQYIRHWGGQPQFDCAHGIAIDNRIPGGNSLLITSRNHNALKRFTMDGQYIETIHLPGSFICRPVIHKENIYLAVFRSQSNTLSSSGYIIILDINNKVISTPGGTTPVYVQNVLQPQGKQGEVFVHPHDVCIDESDNLYVAQWNSNRTYPIKLERI